MYFDHQGPHDTLHGVAVALSLRQYHVAEFDDVLVLALDVQ